MKTSAIFTKKKKEKKKEYKKSNNTKMEKFNCYYFREMNGSRL